MPGTTPATSSRNGSHATGLIVQGDTDAESPVNTDASWKAVTNNAISMIPPDRRKIRGYLVVGPGETAFVRRGAVHGFINVGSGVLKLEAVIAATELRATFVD